MPLYDFRCRQCHHEYQKMTTYSKREEAACPECGSKEKEPVFKANIKGPITSSSSCGPAGSGFT